MGKFIEGAWGHASNFSLYPSFYFQQTFTLGDWPRHFKIDPSGKRLYVTQQFTGKSNEGGKLEVYEISETDARLTLISVVDSDNKPSFVDFL